MLKRLLFTAKRGTIFALSTPPGKSAIALIRVSGNNASSLFPVANPKIAKFAKLKDNDGNLIDTAILTFFKGPNSYTGEDVLEIATHGSIAVIRAIYNHLEMNDCRLADKGEFTHRAYLNNKINISSIESLGSLLDAETELQRKAALLPKLNDGILFERWRNSLVYLLAMYEAQIDFGEDDQIDPDLLNSALIKMKSMLYEISRFLEDSQKVAKLKAGINIAICGIPNAGKSSFINRLCKEQVSIVSEIAGTTRDVVQKYINIGGYPFTISDTAGIHNSENKIEQIGIQRALGAIENAAIVFFIFDPTQDLESQKSLLASINKKSGHVLILCNKSDVVKSPLQLCKTQIPLSCTSEEGFEEFHNRFIELLQSNFSVPDFIVFQNNQITPLNNIIGIIKESLFEEDIVLKAELLRRAIQNIEQQSSPVDLDHVLDSLFSQFCIGK